MLENNTSRVSLTAPSDHIELVKSKGYSLSKVFQNALVEKVREIELVDGIKEE